MWHINEKDQRLRCLEECRRIMNEDGVLLVAYINKLFAMNYFMKNRKFPNEEMIDEIERGDIIKTNGFDDFLDISDFIDPCEIQNEARECTLKIEKNVASDSIACFIQDQIEEMNDAQWESYQKMHLDHCEDKNRSGISMHGLMI